LHIVKSMNLLYDRSSCHIYCSCHHCSHSYNYCSYCLIVIVIIVIIVIIVVVVEWYEVVVIVVAFVMMFTIFFFGSWQKQKRKMSEFWFFAIYLPKVWTYSVLYVVVNTGCLCLSEIRGKLVFHVACLFLQTEWKRNLPCYLT